MTEIVKLYIPAPTMPGGVTEADAVRSKHDPGSYERASGCRAIGNFWSTRADKDWFLDKGKALAAAETARIKRIASLERQIAKLKAIGPFTSEA